MNYCHPFQCCSIKLSSEITLCICYSIKLHILWWRILFISLTSKHLWNYEHLDRLRFSAVSSVNMATNQQMWEQQVSFFLSFCSLFHSLLYVNVSRPGRLREQALLSFFCCLYHQAAGGLKAVCMTSIRTCWGGERLRANWLTTTQLAREHWLCVCVCVCVCIKNVCR